MNWWCMCHGLGSIAPLHTPPPGSNQHAHLWLIISSPEASLCSLSDKPFCLKHLPITLLSTCPAQATCSDCLQFHSVACPAHCVSSCVLCALLLITKPDLIVMFLTAHLRSNNSPSPVLHYPPVHFPCLIGTASADGVRESYLNGWLWYIYIKSTFFFTNLNGILSTLSMFNAELYIVPPLVRQLILPKSQCLVLCLLSSHIYLPDSRLPGSWLANSL